MRMDRTIVREWMDFRSQVFRIEIANWRSRATLEPHLLIEDIEDPNNIPIFNSQAP